MTAISGPQMALSLKWDVRWARTESLHSSPSEGVKGLHCLLRKCLDWEGKGTAQ